LTESERFRRRLKIIGLSDPAIDAAWPDWWSDEADPSSSARLELRFSVARKLGLDARSVLDEDGVPRFIWKDEARFKHLSGESDLERAAISSFGRSISALLTAGSSAGQFVLIGTSAAALRSAVLSSQPYVRLEDLLSLSWSAGIPVAHLRVFPAVRKRMAAMAVAVGERSAILLAKDSMYPPHIAFYLGHELGHIALGHLRTDAAIVDMEADVLSASSDDTEETEADRFALELLTGRADLQLVPTGSYNAPGLAQIALRVSSELHIEPGTLALCFGYSTGNWAVANSAMSFIYNQARPVWNEINRVTMAQLDTEQLPSDAISYLTAVLGAGIAT
jgi:Zn-dependent peptidase ImmA (M78 family)